MKKYEVLVGRLVGEDLGVKFMMDLCVLFRLELDTKDIRYTGVREDAVNFIARRRDTFGGVPPMDIENHGTEYGDLYSTWRGGTKDSGWADVACNYEKETWAEESSPKISQVQSQWGDGVKGHGNKGSGFGKSGLAPREQAKDKERVPSTGSVIVAESAVAPRAVTL